MRFVAVVTAEPAIGSVRFSFITALARSRALDRRPISGTDVTRGRCTSPPPSSSSSSSSSSFPIRVLRDTLEVAVMNDRA